MNKLWKIIAYEYRRHVLRKRFLVALLSVPLWIIAMFGISLLAIVLITNNDPVGYVDPGGFLANTPPEETDGFDPFTVELLSFESKSAAQAALDADTIQAYFVLPANYPQSRAVDLIYKEEPDGDVISQMNSILRRTLLAGQPPEVVKRVLAGPKLEVIATQADAAQTSNENWVKVAMPILAAILLVTSVFTSSGYLMQAVVEEKENRTMEILATSVSATQIMTGKVIALIAVGLTQVLAWTLPPILVLLVAIPYLPFLQGFSVDGRQIGLMLLMVIPTFLLVSALMATIGATVTEAREGQQVSGLVTLPVMLPFMLLGVLISNPSSPIALFLSFFPLTGALTMLLRMAFSSVPAWQIILSTAIMLLSAVGGFWLAGRVFRMGMLRYGQRMGWKDVFQAVGKKA